MKRKSKISETIDKIGDTLEGFFLLGQTAPAEEAQA